MLIITICSNYELVHQIYHINYCIKNEHIVENPANINYENNELQNVKLAQYLFNGKNIQKCDFEDYFLNKQKYFHNSINRIALLTLKDLKDFNYYKSITIVSILRPNSNKAPPFIV